MKINPFILNQILTDNDLSLRLAQVLKIQQVSVKKLAYRGSSKLLHIGAVALYKEFGFTEEQIFESEKV